MCKKYTKTDQKGMLMNKINICENFKIENLPLIFNINYEGFSKYNKNETYINLYNRFFN